MNDSLAGMPRIRIWDLPVRVFHWALVLLIAGAWATAELRWLHWHRPIGYAILALVLFRTLWGFAGSTTARFASFLNGPRALWEYARKALFDRRSVPIAGHNPLGGWNIVAMLVLLLLQIGLGMFAVDVDGLESGPLSHLVDFTIGRWAATTHVAIFNGLLALIGLHIAALFYYQLYKREPLIGAMLSGHRQWPGRTVPQLCFAPLGRAAALFLLSAAIVGLPILLLAR